MTILPSAAPSQSSTQDIRQSKLVNASHEFEAMMLNQMLKPLHFGAGVEEGDEESSGGAEDTVRGLGTEALSKALATHGGVGIAQKIIQEVTREREAVDARRGVLMSNE